MGGVDLRDQSVNTYRIGTRGKKWWWVSFVRSHRHKCLENVFDHNTWKNESDTLC